MGRILSLNGDTQEARDLLSTTSEIKLSEIVRNYPVIFKSLKAFGFKWQEGKYSTPKAFRENYKTKAKLISKQNYQEFIA